VNNSKQDGNEGKKGVSIPRDLIKKRKLTIANPEIGVDPKKEITTFKKRKTGTTSQHPPAKTDREEEEKAETTVNNSKQEANDTKKDNGDREGKDEEEKEKRSNTNPETNSYEGGKNRDISENNKIEKNVGNGDEMDGERVSEDEVEEEKNSIKGATEGNMKDIQIEANLPLLYQVTYQTWKSDGNTNCHLESECKYNVKIKKRTGVKCWRCGNPMHRLCEWRTDERTNIRGPYLCSEACSRIINEILKNKNTKSKNIKVNREWRSNGRAVCYKNKKCKYGFAKITKRQKGRKCWQCGTTMHEECEFDHQGRKDTNRPYVCSWACKEIIKYSKYI